MKYSLFVFLILLLSMSSCCGVKHSPDPMKDEVMRMSMKEIESGQLYGAGEEGIPEGGVIIKSLEDWTSLSNKMNAVNNVEHEVNMDVFNFEVNWLVVYFDRVRGTSGHDVQIVDIRVTNDETKIQIKKTAPQDLAADVLTQPYVIVSTGHFDKPAVFTVIE